MRHNNRFVSLKWKFTLGLSVILISLYSVYSYYVYREASDNFSHSRAIAQENQINIARALTDESFFVLERFIESIVMLQKEGNGIVQLTDMFDQHWLQWQMIWGMGNISLYQPNGELVKNWGDILYTSKKEIIDIVKQEHPLRKIICQQDCDQQVLIPVLLNAKIIAVLGVSLSLSDTLLNYQNTLHSDIGVLAHEKAQKFSAITHAKLNNPLWKQVRSTYKIAALQHSALVFKSGKKRYELRLFPINSVQASAPCYVTINDVTASYRRLQNKFYELAIIGLLGLICTISIVILNIHFALERVSLLSKALPLLVKHQYQRFKEKVRKQKSVFFTDEIQQLTDTALTVAGELDVLSQDVKKNTHLLLKKSSELQNERDFIKQLIDTAPIIILTQNFCGEILSINQEGIYEIGREENTLIGCQFADLIPKNEGAHLRKLQQLTQQYQQKEVTFSGQLALGSSENALYIDWIHTIVHGDTSGEPIIMSLGIDVTERHIADEQLVWMATHDQLTGLSNRHDFQQQLEKMLAIAGRYHEQVTLFYLDLDQFKIINDTYGHQAGDKLLQLVTQILQKEIRETDLLSRIGGDEFALVIPSSDTLGIEKLAKKLLQALKTMDYSINKHKHSVSFSIGIATYPEHGDTYQDLLANADLAMYQAKKTGRSRFHLYSPDFNYQALLSEQLHWKHIIEQSIEQDDFVLYFQPILDIKHKKISHYECLLRIKQADGKILMPGDFIPQAEQLGIIDQIDRLVLRKAIQQHLDFQAMGNNARLAINLSGRSMNDMDIFPYIHDLLSQENVKPDLIIFEITETSAVSNFLSAKTMIKQLKEFGCRFALDDFGVGFSSFYYLKSLPVDYVKIDGSFVKQMDVNNEDRIFVKVLTEVSQAFGKKIIAEFVENKEILGLLGELGVDYAQGYYVSKPIPDPLDLDHIKVE